MKPFSNTLYNILVQRQFYTADLYQITLANGTVLRYASGQSNITSSDGNVYLVAGPGQGPFFDRKDNKAKVIWKLGSGNDQLTIDVIPGSATVGNLTFLDAVRCGMFDGADFQLSRAFMPVTINPPQSHALQFNGSSQELSIASNFGLAGASKTWTAGSIRRLRPRKLSSIKRQRLVILQVRVPGKPRCT